jgi:cytochrome c peroxidase
MNTHAYLTPRPRQASSLPLLTAIGAASAIALSSAALAASLPKGLTLAPDPTGVIATFNVAGAMDLDNPFFRSLGSNGRSCSTCHLAAEAMSFTPKHARQAYDETQGADPLFASVDGANCPSTARTDRRGHSLILGNGLIRIGLAIPATAEYSISLVRDPTGCALRLDPQTNLLTASVYRRPLPAANLSFLSAVMFDGRETLTPLTSPSSFMANLRADLAHQAIDATTGHAQAPSAPGDALTQAIVDFELGLFTAQYADAEAGRLDRAGATGGPVNLASQPYYPGTNDSLGADPFGLPFNATSMSLYQAWESAPPAGEEEPAGDEDQYAARANVAAGEELFNNLPLSISNVSGLNDNPALGRPTSFLGRCTSCHDTPNIGNHSLPLPLDIGTAHSADPGFEPDPAIRAGVTQLSAPQLPVFLVSGCPNPFNAGQPESFYTTDPGKALVSGKCSDFNRLKGPILRGLAARAPYFHNGAAATLLEVVNFYDQRFQIGLTTRQKRELVAFLNSL